MSSSVEENRVRRRAERQGYAVNMSRLRDHWQAHYRTVWLIATADAVLRPDDGERIGPFADLAEVEVWLTTEPSQRPTPAELEKRLVPYYLR